MSKNVYFNKEVICYLLASGVLLVILCSSVGGVDKIKIMIDPGHGGSDPGAIGPDGTTESWINLQIASKAKYYFEQHPNILEVKMSRTSDAYVSLQDRVNLANDWSQDGDANQETDKADYFLSIHHNSYVLSQISPQGTETYCYPGAGTEKRFYLRDRVHEKILWRFGYYNRGTKTADLYVLRETKMPAELSEASEIAHSQEEVDKFKTGMTHIDNEAWAIYAGLMTLLGLEDQIVAPPPSETGLITVNTNQSGATFTISGPQ
jgi:N-acetylmuramoyl-L-alanine amidase